MEITENAHSFSLDNAPERHVKFADAFLILEDETFASVT